MIRFYRSGLSTRVKVFHNVFENQEHYDVNVYAFDTAVGAELLKDRLEQELQNQLNQIAQKAYDEGWKDAKARRAKNRNVWAFFKFYK